MSKCDLCLIKGLNIETRFFPISSSDINNGIQLCNNCEVKYKRLQASVKSKDFELFNKIGSEIISSCNGSSAATQLIQNLANDNFAKVMEEKRKEQIRNNSMATQNGKNEKTVQKSIEPKPVCETESISDKIAKLELIEFITNMPVSTVDLKENYEILGPVSVNTSNLGGVNSQFNILMKKYSEYPFVDMLNKPNKSSAYKKFDNKAVISIIDSGEINNKNYLDKAFHYCLTELKLRCAELGGDAISGMKMDYEYDKTIMSGFSLNIYGTAVRLK